MKMLSVHDTDLEELHLFNCYLSLTLPVWLPNEFHHNQPISDSLVCIPPSI